jgi:hypothetical protein
VYHVLASIKKLGQISRGAAACSRVNTDSQSLAVFKTGLCASPCTAECLWSHDSVRVSQQTMALHETLLQGPLRSRMSL